jgi:hypothetical protein
MPAKKTATATAIAPPTPEALDAAQRDLDTLRHRRYRAGGWSALGREPDGDSVEELDEKIATAAKVYDELRAAADIASEERQAAEAAAEEQRLLDVRKESEQQRTTRAGTVHRAQRALGDLEAAVDAFYESGEVIARNDAILSEAHADAVLGIDSAYQQAVKAAEATFASAHASAATSGATPITELRNDVAVIVGMSKPIEKVLEDRERARQVRDAAIEKAAAERAAAIAALGIDVADDADALARAAEEWRPVLRRLEPPEHLRAITRLIAIARESTTTPIVTLTGERRAERALEVIELARLASS